MSSLAVLNDDVMMIIFTYLEPCNIIDLYDAFPQMVNEIFQRNQHFKMPCDTYISDKLVDWFEMKQFSLDLKIDVIQQNDQIKIFRNHHLYYFACPHVGQEMWYKNGKVHILLYLLRFLKDFIYHL